MSKFRAWIRPLVAGLALHKKGECRYNRQHSEPGVVPGNSKWEITVGRAPHPLCFTKWMAGGGVDLLRR